METGINWNDLLQNGLTTAIDGHFQKEAAKYQKPTEQIKPATPNPTVPVEAVAGTMSQNNIDIGGMKVNKTLLVGGGALLAGALLFKALS